MTEQRYSIPLDELVAGARVPVEAQVEVQAEPRQPGARLVARGAPLRRRDVRRRRR